MKLSLVILLHIFTSVTPLELECYDCTPTSQNNCISPDKYNVTRKVCQENFGFPDGMKEETSHRNAKLVEFHANDDYKFECYSIYLETSSEKRGMHRGCIAKYKEYSTSCEYLRDNINDDTSTVWDCKTCTTSGCNVDNYEIMVPSRLSGVRGSAVLSAPPSTMGILFFVFFSKMCFIMLINLVYI